MLPLLIAAPGDDLCRGISNLIPERQVVSVGQDSDVGLEAVNVCHALVTGVARRRYEFQARQQEVAELRTLSQAAVLDFYRQHFSAGAPGRRKLVVHVVGQSQSADLSAPPVDSGAQLVDSVEELKAGLPMHPAAVRSPPASCSAQV